MKKRKKRMNQNGIAMLSITFVVGVLFIAKKMDAEKLHYDFAER